MTLTQTLLRSPGASARSPRRTGSTATSSWSTRCGWSTRSAPGSSTRTRETRAGDPSPPLTLEPSRPGAATRPASTSRSASRSTAPGVPAASRSSSDRSPSRRRPASRSPCAPTPTGLVSKHLVHDARVGRRHPPLAGRGRVHAAEPAAAAAAADLRRLRHHPGDVDAAHPARVARTAARSRSCTTPSRPTTRSTPTSWPTSPARQRPRLHLLYPEPATRRTHRAAAARHACPTTPTSTPGPAARPGSIETRAGDVRRQPESCGWSTSRPRRSTPLEDADRADPLHAGRQESAANSGATLLEQAEAPGLTPGVRLPDGHLLLLHLPQDRRHRPQRRHRRRVLAARRGHPDLRLPPVGDCAVDL